MEKMTFGEKQERVMVSGNGKVVVLLNEREVENAPSDGEVADGGTHWEYDAVWLDTGGAKDEASLVRAAKAKLLEDIDAWDKGGEVNAFVVNGEDAWLDKGTRVGLMNSATIAKGAGQTEVPLWLNDKSFSVKPDTLTSMLSNVEIYAMMCYNKTAEHKAAVESLESVEDICGYDYKEGYPEKLVINL